MEFVVGRSALTGSATIPGSKSHTIRGLILGALADGTSRLVRPLESDDTRSCAAACRALGAAVDASAHDVWVVHGTGGRPTAPAAPVDVGNSGTTLFLALSAAALGEGLTEFIGDEQTQRRSAGPLLEALAALGATARSRAGNGCVPLVVGGACAAAASPSSAPPASTSRAC